LVKDPSVTKELPIVANDLESDPIGSGYASSLSSPGGNLTGFFLDAPTLCSKWLQQIGDRCSHRKKDCSSIGEEHQPGGAVWVGPQLPRIRNGHCFTTHFIV
jgi:hypothetical protein